MSTTWILDSSQKESNQGRTNLKQYKLHKYLKLKKKLGHSRDCAIFQNAGEKDFDNICEPLNKETCNNVEYKKGPITGKPLESFNLLKTVLCSELVMVYSRSYRIVVHPQEEGRWDPY
jgi:hypothetical protein